MKLLLRVGICLTMVAVCSSAMAATYWNAAAGTTDWTNAGNWNLGVPGPAPADGHAIIHTAPLMPIISSTVPNVAYLTPSWHAADTHVAIKSGGSITSTANTMLGLHGAAGSIATGRLSMFDGSYHNGGGTMYIGRNPFDETTSPYAHGYVNLNGGLLEAGNLGWYGGTGNNDWDTGAEANIDLEVGATLKIGRQLGAGELDWWNGIGLVTSCDGTGIVNESYDAGLGVTTLTATDPFTPFYTADFEDGEVNPGRWPDSGVINTTPYSNTQPEPFLTAPGAEADGDAFGWQNRASVHVDGDTTIVNTESYTGENSAMMENRVLRSDIERTMVAGIYRFTFWYMVPEGQDLSFMNKIVIKDQTHGYLFVDTTGADITTAPAHDVWFSRTVTVDTGDHPTWLAAHAGEDIDFRFGIWASDDLDDVVYTDNWSFSYMVPEPCSLLLIGLAGLMLRRRG